MKGTHTYLVRWTAKTKTSADDPNPFVAKIARKQTITCE
jgi:hypothetical protein